MSTITTRSSRRATRRAPGPHLRHGGAEQEAAGQRLDADPIGCRGREEDADEEEREQVRAELLALAVTALEHPPEHRRTTTKRKAASASASSSLTPRGVRDAVRPGRERARDHDEHQRQRHRGGADRHCAHLRGEHVPLLEDARHHRERGHGETGADEERVRHVGDVLAVPGRDRAPHARFVEDRRDAEADRERHGRDGERRAGRSAAADRERSAARPRARRGT